MNKLREKWTQLRIKLIKEPGWVTVYQSTNEYTVQIRKLTLESHEIPVALFDQRDSSYNAFGCLYMKVPREFEDEAKRILKELEEDNE